LIHKEALDLQAPRSQFQFSKADRQAMLEDVAMADELFDRNLPSHLKRLSQVHWTPAVVAEQVALYLEKLPPTTRLIDIGSGVGKFCVLLALQAQVQISGIENRPELYKISEQIKNANALSHVHFIRGDMLDLIWDSYDVFYLYNPFQEHVLRSDEDKFDRLHQFDRSRYATYTSEVFRQLCFAEPGKHLITYHGYGGLVPESFTLVQQRDISGGELCFWEKTS
jgi:SAM-dependent methyltransferase